MSSWLFQCLCLCVFGADPAAEIVVESAQLTLIEDAEISAGEAGQLTELGVEEGTNVEEGHLLARVDDGEARLLRERAETELQIARAASENDTTVRFAKLALAVARTELERANESNEKFPKSVSQTEVERLKLLVDKSELEIEQAERKLDLDKLSLRTKENDLARATLALEHRQLRAPFPGMVVQLKKHRGEWVDPGTPVLRLIRLDRLRAEAFIKTEARSSDLIGRSVTVAAQEGAAPRLSRTGTLVFVSPEVDPVNGQVRIWAEIDNQELLLRPGQTVRLSIENASTHNSEPKSGPRE